MIKTVGLGLVLFKLCTFAEKLPYQLCNRLSFQNLMMTYSNSNNIPLVADINEWQFSPLKLLSLPIDDTKDNYVRRNVHGVLFSHVSPTRLSSPKLVCYSDDVLINILDMNPEITKTEEFLEFIAGNKILNSSVPVAHRYGGHQFGNWAMQLGDGRAILIGEYKNRRGDRWELQLKGSGKTPYSRDGDGRAVLRSSIREFLCSEAMYYLGIPTSRAAAIVVSNDQVIRDLLYDGHPKLEKTAVVLRVAPTWFRFGSFELPAKNNEHQLLETLVNFILKEHFPDIDDKSEDKILTLLSRICRLTSDLVVAWQTVGFTHGVLNTDNMSVLGITIDYGPFGFMESFNPEYVPNASDHGARYCYVEQIKIVLWNMIKLTEALNVLLSPEQRKQSLALLEAEAKYLQYKYMHEFSKKLGLKESHSDLVKILLKIMEETKADFTMVFRQLSEVDLKHLQKPCSANWALAAVAKHKEYEQFLEIYTYALKEQGVSDEERMKRMITLNPCYVLRNWMAQEVINKAEDGDYSEVERLLRVLKHPFTRQEEAESRGYSQSPPYWASTLRLSCSS